MKVLIVLDDVNDSELLEKLLGALYNFKSGSRIIVTTRDKHVLNKADEIYPLEEYSVHEALQLFNMYAFKQSDRQRDYCELSKSMVYYANGIPLVLTVLARRLCGKDKEVWKSELDKLKKMPPAKVYDVMKLSYDDLEREEQDIFLDLACFILKLLGKVKVDNLKSLLKDEERDTSVVGRLARLKDKSLITSSEDNFISMYDSLQEMGREIVRRDSRKDPGSRSWLWDPDDICEALENDKGTKAIRSIQIDLTKIKERKLSPGLFTLMSGLKFLEIKNGSNQHNIQLEGLQLRFLSWDSYPLTSLPENFSAEKLVMLKLQGGKMEKLWDGEKNLVNLKEVDLSQSKMLKELPDLSTAKNLEVLILNSCFKLIKVQPYIFCLPKLEKLNLSECRTLTKLTSDSGLCSLSDLKLDNCRNLEEFSVISKNMKKLRFRNTKLRSFGQQSQLRSPCPNGSYIESLPSSFNNLTQMLSLEFTNCGKLQTIAELPQNLKTLDVEYCRSLLTITNLPLSLETLNVRACESLQSLPELPSSLQIKTLNATICHSLQSLPELPPSLETLNAHNCTSLHTLPELPCSLETLDVHCCTSLKNLSGLPQSLESLYVQSCSSLQSLPELPRFLKTLDASLCTSLQTLSELPQSLETLHVQSCSSLQNLPELPRSLKTLDARLCTSLQNLSELPQSLESLYVQSCSSLQSLPELPRFLKTLDASLCTSLQTLSELPQSLETLHVQSCSSLQNLPELPRSLKTLDARLCTSPQNLSELPQSLETLDIQSCSSLQSLPELPRVLKTLVVRKCSSLQSLPELPMFLKTLDARYCRSLPSLPQLPQSLETLNVNGCTSLQTLPKHSLFLETLDASDCKLLKTLLLFPSINFEQLRENRTRAMFWNCLNLDENSLEAIGLHAKLNVKKSAYHHISTSIQHHVQNYNDYDDNHNHRSYQVVYMYPGSNVPTWLEYKTTNDYIIIDLSSAPTSPFLGFIFCFVLCEREVKIDRVKGRLEVHITTGDDEGEGRRDNVRMYIDFEGLKIESDHVCVVYDQRCSSFLNSRAKNQTRLKMEVTMKGQDYALPQGYNGGVRFGVSQIKDLGI